jgi:organic hydroperoxide reductase OsmC/OhrA
MPTKTMRRPGARTSGTSLEVGLGSLGGRLGRVELGYELLRPRLDASLEVAPQILARNRQLVTGKPRLNFHQGHCRIPAAVEAYIAFRLRQRAQSPHLPEGTTRPGRSRASETMRFVAVKGKKLRYAVELAAGGELTEENGVVLATPADWTPEHLLLAALVRCSLKSLRFHARRSGVEVRSAAGSARTLVTKRKSDERYAMVDTEVELRVELEPEPDTLAELLARAERDCFVGSSLTAKPRYRWTVN